MIKEAIYITFDKKPSEIFFRKWGDKREVYLDEVLDHLVELKSGPIIAAIFGRGEQTFNRSIKKLFPGVTLNGGQETWGHYLIWKSGLNRCHKCKSIDVRNCFSDNSLCRTCNKQKSLDYRVNLKLRTPPWANLKLIEKFYDDCPEGYEVDHIHPLNGVNICGLHVIDNLQYLTKQANRLKSNKFMLQ